MQGREGLNRAVDGDTVAVELLPEEEWSAPSEIVLQDDGDKQDNGMLKTSNNIGNLWFDYTKFDLRFDLLLGLAEH